MSRKQANRSIRSYFQLFITLSLAGTLSACGDSEESNIVARSGKVRSAESEALRLREAPSTKTGYNAAAYLALSFLPVSQVQRVLDIAQHGREATSLEACQKENLKIETDATGLVDTITVTTDEKACKKSWKGLEVFTVTYSAKVGSPTRKIQKIEKKKGEGLNDPDLRLITTLQQGQRTTDLNTGLTITLRDNLVWEFEYDSDLKSELSRASTETSKKSNRRRGRNREPKKNKTAKTSSDVVISHATNESSLLMSGFIHTQTGKWQITTARLKTVTSGTAVGGEASEVNLVVAQPESNWYTLKCGRLIGTFTADQSRKTTTKTTEESYGPLTVQILNDGVLQVDGSNLTQPLVTCDVGTQALVDITQVLDFGVRRTANARSPRLAAGPKRSNKKNKRQADVRFEKNGDIRIKGESQALAE